MLNSKPLTIAFCLPGSTFTQSFLSSWTTLLVSLSQNNIKPFVGPGESSNVYLVRAACMGGNVLRGINQKPFDGKIDYDYMMWIDSDQKFEPAHFYRLLSHGKDIVAGVYRVSDSSLSAGHFSDMSEEGNCKPLTAQDVKGEDLIEVDYTGFGFLLVKRGVFESIEYPWFRPREVRLNNGVLSYMSEDVSWSCHVRDKGHKIFVDPTVCIGHEKPALFFV